MDDSRTVVLGGREITISAPSSYTERSEIWLLAADNRVRGIAAALGACWRGPGRPKVRYAACGYSPAVYGGRVLDELVERGYPLAEILRAGGVALEVLAGGLVTEQEVADAEGFSDAGEAA